MGIIAAFAVPHPPLAVPAVGRGRERDIAPTLEAYREVARRIAALAPDVIVLSSPHAELYLDYFHIAGGPDARGDLSQFGAGSERAHVTYDEGFVREVSRRAKELGIPAGTAGERDPELDHATMVPLHFLREAGVDVPLVRLGLSGLSPLAHYELGMLIARTAEKLGRRAVYVASGDLSHKLTEDGPYGFSFEGPEFDRAVCQAFELADFGKLLEFDEGFCERAAECGLRSFQIMAGSLDRTPVKSELLSYEGPFGVGYGVAAFEPTGEPGSAPERDFAETYERWHEDRLARIRADEDPYVSLARRSLETFVRTGHRIEVPRDLRADLPAGPRADLLGRRAGCFVSIKVDGQLRGCIGTISPVRDSLAEEICANAISAGRHDPRFPPVEAEELDQLVYDVDVFGETELVSGPDGLDPSRYGVVVSTDDGRRGVLLPDLDGVDTVDEQVGIAARKGGIDLVRDEVTLDRFEVVRHL